jgi:hypothetical protein
LADLRTTASVHWEGIRSTLLDAGTSAWLEYFRAPAPRAAGAHDWPLAARWVHAPDARPGVVVLHFALRLLLVFGVILSMIGLAGRGAWRKGAVVLAIVVSVYLVFMSGGPVGYHRFRLPIVPVMCILAGNGASMVLGRLNSIAAIRR